MVQNAEITEFLNEYKKARPQLYDAMQNGGFNADQAQLALLLVQQAGELESAVAGVPYDAEAEKTTQKRFQTVKSMYDEFFSLGDKKSSGIDALV